MILGLDFLGFCANSSFFFSSFPHLCSEFFEFFHSFFRSFFSNSEGSIIFRIILLILGLVIYFNILSARVIIFGGDYY